MKHKKSHHKDDEEGEEAEGEEGGEGEDEVEMKPHVVW